MTINKVGEFYEDEGVEKLGILPSIGIDSLNITNCINEINSRNVERIFGHPGFGFTDENLDFLEDIPHIKQIHFWDIKVKNIDGLYFLEKLESIQVEPRRPGIDFSRLKSLEHITAHYHVKDTGFDTLLNLKKFHSWNFKPKSKSFIDLILPPNIEELSITKANPISLDGIQKLPKLKKLGIHYCRNIESIDKILEAAPNIEFLLVEKCSKVQAYEFVKRLKKINFVNVNGKTIIKNGEIYT